MSRKHGTHGLVTRRFVTLRDLPIIQGFDRDACASADTLSEQYVTERKLILSREQIRPFTVRWSNLWRLDGIRPLRPNGYQRAVSRCIRRGDFDPRYVLPVMNHQEGDPYPPQRRDTYVGAELAIPFPLLCALQLAHHYGVGTDLAMVRLFLDRYESGDDRWVGPPHVATVEEPW